MLQKIQRTDTEELVAFLKRDDTIARDSASGATLHKSDGQYVLIIPSVDRPSRWSRRIVQSDEEALERAQKILEQRHHKSK